MILPDVNVLVYSYHEDSPNHAAYKRWLDASIDADEPVGLSELVLSATLRIVTNHRVFERPAPIELALTWAATLRTQPNTIAVRPGLRHWQVFERLCRAVGAKGNDITDAYLAALAIERGADWLTADRGFARFPDLRWRHPLEPR